MKWGDRGVSVGWNGVKWGETGGWGPKETAEIAVIPPQQPRKGDCRGPRASRVIAGIGKAKPRRDGKGKTSPPITLISAGQRSSGVICGN